MADVDIEVIGWWYVASECVDAAGAAAYCPEAVGTSGSDSGVEVCGSASGAAESGEIAGDSVFVDE